MCRCARFSMILSALLLLLIQLSCGVTGDRGSPDETPQQKVEIDTTPPKADGWTSATATNYGPGCDGSQPAQGSCISNQSDPGAFRNFSLLEGRNGRAFTWYAAVNDLNADL